jgi:DedD protein
LQQATKQRIVGSVVLIALALIFLPIVFDGEGSYDTQISSRIPDIPEIEPFTVAEPTRPVIQANQPNFATEASSNTDTTAEQAQQEPDEIPLQDTDLVAEGVAEIVTSEPSYVRQGPELGPDGLPAGWSVRLGTFSDSDNAAALLERLLDADYKAYSRTLQRDQGELTAIYVGPWLDRARVDNYLKELQTRFNLAGIIERYTIDPL